MTDKELRATDLMVGDWVLYKGELHQIVDIDRFSTMVESKTTIDSRADFDEIEPIPLTPEILEKNGFVKGELSISSQYNLTVGKSTIGVTLKDTPDKECAISAWNYEGKLLCNLESTSRDNCQWYVHQLQRVLKLCNIDKNIVL